MFKSLRKKALVLLLLSQPLVHSIDSGSPGPSSIDNYEQVLEQVSDFEIALQAMDYLLDDRNLMGTALLKANNVSKPSGQPRGIFTLALGVMEFIEATLGFEPEVMARAHLTLLESESAQLNNSKYNVKNNLVTSHIYPPGTEFQVTYAESTLLNALLMLLTENNGVLEGAKALFKLRRAYQTLDSIYNKVTELEDMFSANLSKQQRVASTNLLNLSSTDLPGYKLDSDKVSLYSGSVSNQDLRSSLDDKLLEKMEKVYLMRRARFDGTSVDPDNGSSKEPSEIGKGPSGTRISLQSRGPSIKNIPEKSASYLEKLTLGSDDSDSDSDEFADALEHHEEDRTFGRIEGRRPRDLNGFANKHLDSKQPTLKVPKHVEVNGSESAPNGVVDTSVDSLLYKDSLTVDPYGGSFVSLITSNSTRADHIHVSTIDEFIHSGVQLCFGILQVVLSLIPPAIGKVLSIVGFRGDKEKGLKMLWRTAITSRNIHGELALLSLAIFYDGPLQFIDLSFQLPGHEDHNITDVINTEGMATVSESELDRILANPALYTPQLLLKAKRIFPHNALWVLQEGRMLAAQGKLHAATAVMQDFTDNPANKIQMQQIEALLVFDRATFYTFAHDYDRAARDFIYLIDINSWSKAVYLFMAASCYLAKYRMIKLDLVNVEDKKAELERYGGLAKKYFDLAPTYVPGYGSNAKKGGIGGANKQMPFDKFLLRKLKTVSAVHKKHPDIPFIDCFGTSPIHELVYFWNGYKRMPPQQLEWSVKILGYSGAPNAPYSENSGSSSYALIEETPDELMLRYMFQAIALRQLGEVSKGQELLDTYVIDKYVLSLQPFRFTKMTYSPYLYPTALHEKTVFVWELYMRSSGHVNLQQAITESQKWLERAETVGEGDYELSNRTGLCIKAAADRLEELLKKVKGA